MLPTLETRIEAIQTGTPKPLLGEEQSAIFKAPVAGPLTFGPTGIEGDVQVDLEHHGGIDKAVHFYSSDHYAFWKAEFPDAADMFAPGAFGENLVASGLLEADVCLGDEFTLGTVRLAVSQGRQPCWKLGAKTGVDRLPLMVERTGKTGLYFRVIENGTARAGDTLKLVARPHPDWPLTRLWETLFRKGAKQEDLETLVAMPALAKPWQERARKKLTARS